MHKKTFYYCFKCGYQNSSDEDLVESGIENEHVSIITIKEIKLDRLYY